MSTTQFYLVHSLSMSGAYLYAPFVSHGVGRNNFTFVPFSSYMALQLFYRVLAFSTNSFHRLSWARVFQFGTFIFCISFLTSYPSVSLVFLLAFLKWVSRSILPLPFSYLASFQCDRASSVFVLG